MQNRTKTQRTMTRWGVSLLSLLALAGCEQGLGGGFKSAPKVTLIVSGTAGGDIPVVETTDAAPQAVAGFGTIKGKVTVDGALPTLAMKLEKGQSTKDAVCAINGVPDESVSGENGGLANVFIYLKKTPKGVDIPAAPAMPVTFDQQGCKFLPHAFIARVGQTINVKNSDPVAHNVHSFSLNKPLNSALQGNDTKGTDLIYEKAEPLPIRTVCDFHAWMDSFHLVVDHPWAVISTADGSFEIPNAPAGKQEFVVWHEKIGYVERSLKVDIVPDQVTEISVKVLAAKLSK
ncbi:MAG: hypothetical protein DWH91_18610 [Planctomycetota bacterium]|nr:MAG: hypothetical protein DWH91_18610 [Planctomycetota bacterium]